MIQKKICMLGTVAVGKTSLVARYVHSIFSERYQTTVGVKIDRKEVRLGDRKITLVLWDLYGDNEFQRMQASYLRGAAGYLLVCDGTRRSSFDHALRLRKDIQTQLGRVPFILLCNKSDLADQWELGADDEAKIKNRGWHLLKTSAKNGENVEDAFLLLTERILESAP